MARFFPPPSFHGAILTSLSTNTRRDHAHDHGHAPAHDHAPGHAQRPSALARGAGFRVGVALAVSAVLWLAVLWALG